MKLSQIKEIIKATLKEQQPEAPTREVPTKPDKETPKRRRISPPKPAPETKPKAVYEEELVNKIAKRFRELKKS